MKRYLFVGFLAMLLCVSCSRTYDHKGKTPLVELNGSFLYQEDLQRALPTSLTTDDSLLFAERYIRAWVEDMLLYQKAKNNILNSAEIDVLVENYRKALIVHAYQQALIHQRLSGEISEEALEAYYKQNQAVFRAERPLIKGLFIKVPITAPQLNNVRRWYKSDSREAVENLEKYSLKNAVNYEYFYDKWVTASEVIDLMPLQVTDPETYLDTHRQIELKDTAFCYFLHVTDFRAAGEQEPYEFARLQVKNMVQNQKQVEFMKQVKDDLYQQAVKRDKIKVFSIENPK